MSKSETKSDPMEARGGSTRKKCTETFVGRLGSSGAFAKTATPDLVWERLMEYGDQLTDFQIEVLSLTFGLEDKKPHSRHETAFSLASSHSGVTWKRSMGEMAYTP